MYCDYCGLSYLTHKCILCGASISTCGCDCARDVCEEHFCAKCSEPYNELDEYGWCKDCADIFTLDRLRAAVEAVLVATGLSYKYDEPLYPNVCKVLSVDRILCEIVIQDKGIMVLRETPSAISDALKESILMATYDIFRINR